MIKIPDKIISVRIPAALLEDLKKKAAQDHFMDVSEAVRHIVRTRAPRYLVQKQNSGQAEQLITGLQNLLQQLQDDAQQEE